MQIPPSELLQMKKKLPVPRFFVCTEHTTTRRLLIAFEFTFCNSGILAPLTEL